jgi:2-dehydropantoate 2-reductase
VIRNAVWDKLIFNVIGNAVQALTRETCAGMVADPQLLQLSAGMFEEMFAIGAAVKPVPIDFSATLEDMRVRVIESGDAKASTLQDVEAGRPLEKDAIWTAVQEVARTVGVKTPLIDMAAALLQALERNVVVASKL